MSVGLTGLRLWVTRPQNQAANLIAAIRSAGANAVALPLLEIAPPLDLVPFDTALAQLDLFDLAIFVSPSALDAVLERLPHAWPANLPVAVMGPGSMSRAQAYGISRIIRPDSQFDSAGLLQLPEMQHLSGLRMVLFRGDGGRESLPRILRERGAELRLVQAYRRLPPAFDDARLHAELDRGCDGVIVSSSDAVQYLFRIAGGLRRQQLQSLLYFAPHPRIIETLAAENAFRAVQTEAGDVGITATIIHYFSQTLGPALTAKNTHDAG